MQLTSHVYQFSRLRGMGIWGANVFLLVSDTLTLVDTGTMRSQAAEDYFRNMEIWK